MPLKRAAWACAELAKEIIRREGIIFGQDRMVNPDLVGNDHDAVLFNYIRRQIGAAIGYYAYFWHVDCILVMGLEWVMRCEMPITQLASRNSHLALFRR